MFDKFAKGQTAMLKVQLRAAELGVVAALPTTEARYDLLIDDGKKIHRAQVKYAGAVGCKVDGAVTLDLRKATRGNGNVRPYTKDEIDVVLVYVPQTDTVMWIGPELFDGKHSLSFRFEKAKNGQSKGVRVVGDFAWVCSSTGRASAS